MQAVWYTDDVVQCTTSSVYLHYIISALACTDDVVQCTWVPSMLAVQYTSALSCVQGSTHKCCSIVPCSTREFPTHVSELACKYTRGRTKLACKFACSVHDNFM